MTVRVSSARDSTVGLVLPQTHQPLSNNVRAARLAGECVKGTSNTRQKRRHRAAVQVQAEFSASIQTDAVTVPPPWVSAFGLSSLQREGRNRAPESDTDEGNA